MKILSLKKLLYGIYRSIYRYTPSHQKSQEITFENSRIENQAIDRILQKLEKADGFTVMNGPFVGMKYQNKSSGSALLPKLIGSYEEPIHDWIFSIIQSQKFDKIIDIGCAEGFYAVGFGMTFPNASIIACDNNPEALNLARNLAKLNHITNIEFEHSIDHQYLEKNCNRNTLIFCDIEGYERELLNPHNCPALKNCDILVEVHDCFIPGLKETLIERFKLTHSINLALDYSFRFNNYNIGFLSADEQIHAVNEKRPPNMSWLYLKSFSQIINSN